MYLVAGLGNPGSRYDMTRHNIGFEVIDYIADKNNVRVNKLKFKAVYGEMQINGEKVYLVKPQTYMNLSGESLIEFVKFFKIPIDHVIVISDDISLAPGRIRVRAKGSDGGHNGLKNIIYMLEKDQFPRVRVGVGEKPAEWDLADYVLSRFTREEIPVLEDAIIRAAGAVEEIICKNVSSAMNKYNAN